MLPRSRRESQTFGWPEPGTPDAGFGGGAAALKSLPEYERSFYNGGSRRDDLRGSGKKLSEIDF